MGPIQQLHTLGQSLWYDNIRRSLLENGELARLIEHGEIRGITSNPSIFNQAIGKSNDYDAALKTMAWAGWKAVDIFDQLAIEDIQAAADLFSPIYRQTNGGDGYVSLEVNPLLAHDIDSTISEASRLWARVNRPNLMVKIPATQAGIPAIRRSIAAGININITLIFSLARYMEVMDAYLSGLEDRVQQGLPIDRIASVASFFVSRVDTKVDARLDALIREEGLQAADASRLLGRAGIANARMAYARFLDVFSQERFLALEKLGARRQRPLWASTSTKDPRYSDIMYVEELAGNETVNTVPPQTLDAFRDHGQIGRVLDEKVEVDEKAIQDLAQLGISMDQVTQELEDEGVKAFSDAFGTLVNTIETRSAQARRELGPLREAVVERVRSLESQDTVGRIARGDATLWTADEKQHAEIQKRLGWLNVVEPGEAWVRDLAVLHEECSQVGYTHALLLGMGGSSLAPEVYREIAGLQERDGLPPLDLSILDSTDPTQVAAAAARSEVPLTLYIVSSKSGTTGEVQAFLDYFWAGAEKRLGRKAGKNFVAITDPGTPLEKIARERGFRRVLLADPNVGGRYSALTVFGLIAAELIGMDVVRLLAQARQMAALCKPEVPSGRNPGLVLGAILGEAYARGRNKLTVLADSQVCPFGSWLEQLVAESSGKDGRGIVPVDMEPYAQQYSPDRLFVYFRKDGEREAVAQKILEKGQPVLTMPVADPYALGPAFYEWEMAVAIATAVLGVNGFNQPDVQDNKTRTNEKVALYRSSGQLVEGQPIWEGMGGRVYGQPFPGLERAASLKEVVAQFLQQRQDSGYVAINAYMPRNPQMLAELQELRKSILSLTGQATTLGFGPRFLHSTGQLHKGGPESALFLQITQDAQADIEIPTEGITFGVLERAQAVGDLEALLARNRRAIRVHLTDSRLADLI